MTNKFTFKKAKRETGLAAVANPYPFTYIKHNKQWVGTIYPPSRFGRDQDKWHIGLLTVAEVTGESPCSFVWSFFKARFDTEPEAREWLNKQADTIFNKLNIYHHGDCPED